jgi:hypothetical protein
MILSGHQPCYLPGLQFFSKVMHSDAFMHVPHCQYLAGSWHSHNFIHSGKLVVPIHATLGQAIDEVKVDYSQSWRRKHCRAIELTYSKFPYFAEHWPDIQWFIEEPWDSLALLNMNLTEYLMEALGCGRFRTKIYTSRYYESIFRAEDPIDMLIAMCKAVGCDTYLSNEGAHAYIDNVAEKRMADAGITHRWFTFVHPYYGQDIAPNQGRLSVVDLLFTQGPEAAKIIKAAGSINDSLA